MGDAEAFNPAQSSVAIMKIKRIKRRTLCECRAREGAPSGASKRTVLTELPPAKSPLTPFPPQQCRPRLQPGCSRKVLKSVVLTPQQLQYFTLHRAR